MINLSFALLALLLIPSSHAEDGPTKGKWVRNLPDGVTVELLGICDPGTKAWWTPDGTALAEPICNIFDFGVSGGGKRQRGFAVRVLGPDINATVQWVFDPYSGGQGGSAVKDGEQLRGVRWEITEFPAKTTQTSVKLKVAATPWVTAAALSHSAFRVVDSLCVSSFGSVWSNVQKSYLGKPRPRT
jgi:hypothetical protein